MRMLYAVVTDAECLVDQDDSAATVLNLRVIAVIISYLFPCGASICMVLGAAASCPFEIADVRPPGLMRMAETLRSVINEAH